MKIIGRAALAAVATAGLIFGTSVQAAAVGQHEHCLLTPDGWVIIAEGVSEVAWDQGPALDMFHEWVHKGQPADELTIVPIPVGGECPALPEVTASG